MRRIGCASLRRLTRLRAARTLQEKGARDEVLKRPDWISEVEESMR